MSRKELLLTLVVLLPVSAFAHGEEVLVSFFYDLLTVIGLIIFIACIKWNSNGKYLLAVVLAVSALSVFIGTGKMPYYANRTLIDILCIGVPVTSVLAIYFIFRRKFSGK
jgi:hypothetical protein